MEKDGKIKAKNKKEIKKTNSEEKISKSNQKRQESSQSHKQSPIRQKHLQEHQLREFLKNQGISVEKEKSINFSDHQPFFHEDSDEMEEVYLKKHGKTKNEKKSHKLSKADKNVKMFFETESKENNNSSETENDSSQQSDTESEDEEPLLTSQMMLEKKKSIMKKGNLFE